MKLTVKIITVSVISFLLCACSSPKNSKEITFKVWGNCEMCKETIETALKTDGIIEANWNVDTKQIAITYDTLKIKPLQIHEKIAAAGYDTDLATGDSIAYTNLHTCCQYDRKATK